MNEHTMRARYAFMSIKRLEIPPEGVPRGDGAMINETPHPHMPPMKPTYKGIPDGNGDRLCVKPHLLREFSEEVKA